MIQARVDARVQGRDSLDDALDDLRRAIMRGLSKDAMRRDALDSLELELDGDVCGTCGNPWANCPLDCPGLVVILD